MVLVKTSIHAVRRENIENDSELLWVSVNLQSSEFLFGVFYRPPHCSDHVSLLYQSLANVPTSTNLVLCGDCNALEILLFLYHLINHR